MKNSHPTPLGPVEIGDTVRIALGRDRWTLKRVVALQGGDYGVLEKQDGKGTIVTYAKLHSLVKAKES